MSTPGSWSSLKEVRSWAAMDESLWSQFANALGDGIGQHFFAGSASTSRHQGSAFQTEDDFRGYLSDV